MIHAVTPTHYKLKLAAHRLSLTDI